MFKRTKLESGCYQYETDHGLRRAERTKGGWNVYLWHFLDGVWVKINDKPIKRRSTIEKVIQ